MNFEKEYKAKLGTLEDELASVKSGDIICTSGQVCEPIAFYENLHKVIPYLDHIELLKGRGPEIPYPFMTMPEFKDKVDIICHLYGTVMRKTHELGLSSHLPSNLHDMMQRRTQYKPVIDKFVAMATPMDEDGNFTVSGCGMWEECAYEHSAQVILEVNPNLPKFPGCLTIPLNKVDMIVEVDYPIPTYDVRSTPSEMDKIIGGYAADFVHDGDCIQLGLGGMPDAVGNAFFEKKELGLHTELFTPVMGDLIQAGIITGEHKNIDTGKHVGNFIMGDQKFYDIMSTTPNVLFRQATYTNDPYVIAQIDNFVSINTALEIDLTGQISSESIGPKQFSGTGGAFDFAYGAQHSKGGRGIIAMASTAKGGTMSKIKPILTPGAIVTISRNVADIIITEYGVAYMRGRSVKERALQLINIAHPKFRDQLTKEAREYGYI